MTQANQRPVAAARRRADAAQTWSRVDGRRPGRDTVDQEASLAAAAARGRRRSMFVGGGPTSSAGDDDDDDDGVAARSTRRRQRSLHAPATGDVAPPPPPHDLSLHDELRHQRRSTGVPLVGKQSTPAGQTSSELSVARSATVDGHGAAFTAAAPVRLQLQTKVKVSERPVRCLVNIR